MVPHPDQRYILALLQNDGQVIAEIYTRFSKRIEHLVQSNHGDADDACDVFQEALIAISRQIKRPGFVLTCAFETYLWCVCRGKWLNELKRRRRTTVTILQASGYMASEDAEMLAEGALREEKQSLLFHQCFEQLSAGCRQLLQLAWSGISMEKVSRQLGITYGFARKRKSECAAMLVHKIKALMADPKSPMDTENEE